MNSGSAVRVQLVLLPQIDVAMIEPAGASVPTRKIASPVAMQRDADPQAAHEEERERDGRKDGEDG